MRETTLNDLFVRDLDQIPLPPRAQWIRRPADVVRAERLRRSSFAFATAIVALLIVAIIVGLQTPAAREVLDRLREGLTQPDTYEYPNARIALGNLELLEINGPTSTAILTAASSTLESILRARGHAIDLERPAYTGRLDADFGEFRRILREVSRRTGMDPGDLEDLAIAGMATVGGPCNSFYGSARVNGRADRALSSFPGRIGANWDHMTAHTDLPAVQVVWRGGPGERAGLRAGDRIQRIDGVEVSGLAFREALAPLMSGQPGSVVQVDVKRGSAELRLSITRAAVTAPHLDPRMIADGVVYLDLRPAGYSESDLRRAIEIADPPDRGWILDLRVAEISDEVRDHLVGSFAGPGAYATGIGPAGTFDQGAEPNVHRVAQRPIVVLISGLTSQGALTVAAALRERGLARLIGEPSGRCDYAYATVPLRSGTLFIRDARFVSLPGRRDLNAGIEPDELVRDTASGDAQLDAAVAWLRSQAR